MACIYGAVRVELKADCSAGGSAGGDDFCAFCWRISSTASGNVILTFSPGVMDCLIFSPLLMVRK